MLLQTLKFTLLLVGYLMIVSIPLVDGEYPVDEVGSALKSAIMLSVVATPVAEVVTAEAHAPDEIEPVPSAEVPLAIVVVPLLAMLFGVTTNAVTGEPNPVSVYGDVEL